MMKEKRDNTDANANPAITGTELAISSSHPGEHEKITEIIRLDEKSESRIRQPTGPRTDWARNARAGTRSSTASFQKPFCSKENFAQSLIHYGQISGKQCSR